MALVLSGSIDISGSMTATTILISSPGAAGMVSSSAQITELAPLMQSTSSINNLTGSLITTSSNNVIAIDGLNTYTASIKGATIVSSSQQIQNYFTFAQTSSANTFYGVQTFNSSISTAGVVSTSDIRSNSGASDGQVLLSKMGGSYYGGGVYYAGDNGSSQSGFRTGMYYFGSTSNYVIERSTNTQSYGNSPAVLTYTPALSIGLGTGDVVISTGNLSFANGKGIDFSATANSGSTTTSELLNDYEEGTWTATATYSGTNTPTHAYQTGHYTKIGRVVQIQALISWNENGSTGNLTITGLPFTANSTVARTVTSMMNFGFSGLTTNLVGEVENSTTFIKIRKADNAGTIVTATDTDNDQDLYISCAYMV